MSLARLRAEIPPHEVARWIAFNRIEPIGEYRADLRAAFMTYNIIRALVTAECANKLKVSDFMLDFTPREPDSEEQTEDQIAAVVNAIAQCFGG